MSSSTDPNTWFASWFDSPYYHLLYRKRNHDEAAAFIHRIIEFLHPAPHATALDLACGRGRHSIELHKLGLQVTGIDLSHQSILKALDFEDDGLEFFEHDMRRPFRIRYYDYIFNLFTSFGYFESFHDNQQAASSICKGLRPGGVFVFDFFNAAKVRSLLKQPHAFDQDEDGVIFHIEKYIEDRRVIKNISFTDCGKSYAFTERVQLIDLNDFKKWFEPTLTIEHVFGSCQLEPFSETTSDRLIVIARKIN